MTINYLFFGLHKTDGKEIDKDFKELFELFFEVYLNATGDYELLKVLQPFYAFRGLVVASPVWYPHISLETWLKLFNFIRNVLDAAVSIHCSGWILHFFLKFPSKNIQKNYLFKFFSKNSVAT